MGLVFAAILAPMPIVSMRTVGVGVIRRMTRVMAKGKNWKKKLAGLTDDERTALRAALDNPSVEPDDDDEDDDTGTDPDIVSAISKLTEAGKGLDERITKLEKLAKDNAPKKRKGLFDLFD